MGRELGRQVHRPGAASRRKRLVDLRTSPGARFDFGNHRRPDQSNLDGRCRIEVAGDITRLGKASIPRVRPVALTRGTNRRNKAERHRAVCAK